MVCRQAVGSADAQKLWKSRSLIQTLVVFAEPPLSTPSPAHRPAQSSPNTLSYPFYTMATRKQIYTIAARLLIVKSRHPIRKQQRYRCIRKTHQRILFGCYQQQHELLFRLRERARGGYTDRAHQHWWYTDRRQTDCRYAISLVLSQHSDF